MVSLKGYFLLDPDIIVITNGALGVIPKPVLEVYQNWQGIGTAIEI